MKTIIKTAIVLGAFALSLQSCKKENEEGEIDIHFKSESGYTYSSQTIASGTAIKIGIEAETEKKKDPLIKFNISESINNGTSSTIYSDDLDDQKFEYDHNLNLTDTVQGNTHKYTFTVTNRDGINAQKSLTITIQ